MPVVGWGKSPRPFEEGKIGGETVHVPLYAPAVLDAVGNPILAGTAQDGAIKISTNDIYIFDEFGSLDDFNANWVVARQTGDASYQLANSELQISTGTQANSEIIILSRKKVRLGQTRLQFAAYLSQRIANQEFYVELVDAEGLAADGTGGDELCGFGFWGTSATTAYVRYGDHGFGQVALGAGDAVTIGSTASYQLFEFDADVDDLNFFYRSANSANARSTLRTQNANYRPNPSEDYVVRIRVRNTAAPASSTTFYLASLLLDDHTRFAVEVASGRGIYNAAQGIPVVVANVVASGLRNRRVEYTDSTTPLAANATFIGSTRDYSSSWDDRRAFFVARAYADQPGTLYIEQSRDGTTWRTPVDHQVALAAGETRQLKVPLIARYVRVKYVNGATAQGAFELISCTTEI